MIKIIADDNIPFLRGVFEPYAEIKYIAGDKISREDVVDANVLIIRTRTRCDASLLSGTKVQMISTATIGFDHIDIPYCISQNIKVTTAQGCNAHGVAQWVMASLIEADITPTGSTIGIIGVGNVGSSVRDICMQLGMIVLCNDPIKESLARVDNPYVSLDYLLANSDVVTMHTPLSLSGEYRTIDMADDTFFEKMKTGSLFLNSSRGEVVDEDSLLNAIYKKNITACIDVWRDEPHINKVLLSKCIVSTPHIAGYSLQGKANGSSMVVCDIANHFNIEPIKNWFPIEVSKTPLYSDTSWRNFKKMMKTKYDIKRDSFSLKETPDMFEQLRNNYHYRDEFF